MSVSTQVCCVCQTQPGSRLTGGRWFCSEHEKKATYNRKGFWRSSLIAALAVLVFVAAVVAFDVLAKPQLAGSSLILVGCVLALVPALLWLIAFYALDRVEPEPVGQVARLFVIGLALAGAIGIPLLSQFFRVQDWLYRSALNTVLGSVFVTSAVEIAILYAAVRYFIYDSPEFDERTDGVIYGMAAGLGYATALNVQFILTSGGARLGAAEIYVAEVALAHAALGGLLGYFLGRAKMQREPVWRLPLGVLLTVLLNGLFLTLRGQLETGSIAVGSASGLPSVTSLVLSGVLAIVVTGVVAWLVRSDIARLLAGKEVAPAPDAAQEDRKANLLVIAATAVLLVAGCLVWNGAVSGTRAFNVEGISGAYPSYYSPVASQDRALAVQDAFGAGAKFGIRMMAVADVSAATSALAGERGADYAAYKVVSHDKAVVNGQQAVRQRFAYVNDGGLSAAAPQLIQGEDYVFMRNGQAVVVTLESAAQDFAQVAPLFARFVSGLSF